MMKRIFLMTLASLIAFSNGAKAAHCKYGQIYRISMHTCVSIHSKLALGYLHFTARYGEKHRGTGARTDSRGRATPIPCDPRTMCGDPIEDRVDDTETATPAQTGDTTPRDISLPDAFNKSRLGGYHINWRL